jgi:hypothetical protein
MYKLTAYENIYYTWQYGGSSLIHSNSYELTHNLYLSYNNNAAVWKIILDEKDDSYIWLSLPKKDAPKAKPEDLYIKASDIENKDSFYHFMDEYMKLRRSSLINDIREQNYIDQNMFTYKILEEEKLRKNAISKYTDKMGIAITSCNNFYSINEIKRKGTSYEVTLYETIKYNWQNIKGFYNLSSGLYVQHKILFE